MHSCSLYELNVWTHSPLFVCKNPIMVGSPQAETKSPIALDQGPFSGVMIIGDTQDLLRTGGRAPNVPRSGGEPRASWPAAGDPCLRRMKVVGEGEDDHPSPTRVGRGPDHSCTPYIVAAPDAGPEAPSHEDLTGGLSARENPAPEVGAARATSLKPTNLTKLLWSHSGSGY